MRLHALHVAACTHALHVSACTHVSACGCASQRSFDCLQLRASVSFPAAAHACPVHTLITPANNPTCLTPMRTRITLQAYHPSVILPLLEQQPDLVDAMLQRLIADLPRDAAADAGLSAAAGMGR